GPSGIFFAVTVSPYNSAGRNMPGFRPDGGEQFPLAYPLDNSTRASEKRCQTIGSVSSATRLLRHHVALFVGRLRRGRLGEFLEARIIPERIEHRIELEQRGSEGHGRSQWGFIRCRKQFLQRGNGAIRFAHFRG